MSPMPRFIDLDGPPLSVTFPSEPAPERWQHTLQTLLDNEAKYRAREQHQQDRIAAVEAVLAQAEWSGLLFADQRQCPVCEAMQRDGHDDGCALAALLHPSATAPRPDAAS